MKRPVVWIAAGFVVGIVIAALIPVGLYWMFLSGRAWPMALSKEIFWMVAAVFALAAILSVIGLTCLLRRTFRVWWIGAFAWALATISGRSPRCCPPRAASATAPPRDSLPGVVPHSCSRVRFMESGSPRTSQTPTGV